MNEATLLCQQNPRNTRLARQAQPCPSQVFYLPVTRRCSSSWRKVNTFHGASDGPLLSPPVRPHAGSSPASLTSSGRTQHHQHPDRRFHNQTASRPPGRQVGGFKGSAETHPPRCTASAKHNPRSPADGSGSCSVPRTDFSGGINYRPPTHRLPVSHRLQGRATWEASAQGTVSPPWLEGIQNVCVGGRWDRRPGKRYGRRFCVSFLRFLPSTPWPSPPRRMRLTSRAFKASASPLSPLFFLNLSTGRCLVQSLTHLHPCLLFYLFLIVVTRTAHGRHPHNSSQRATRGAPTRGTDGSPPSAHSVRLAELELSAHYTLTPLARGPGTHHPPRLHERGSSRDLGGARTAHTLLGLLISLRLEFPSFLGLSDILLQGLPRFVYLRGGLESLALWPTVS